MECMIEIENLSLTMKKQVILSDINLTFEKGKIHGLIGRNGSGKTMLMKCILGFIRPSQGTIWVDHKRIGKEVDFPPHTGVIIETPGFIPHYSGYKNLKVLAELNGKIDRGQILHTMELVGLNPNLRRSVKKYSLGMRQRLGIAQAIMEEPNLLVLDEPFNGLDAEQRVFCRCENCCLRKKRWEQPFCFPLIMQRISKPSVILFPRWSRAKCYETLDLNLLSCYIGFAI